MIGSRRYQSNRFRRTVTRMTDRFRSGAGRPCLDFIRTLRYRGTPSETEELSDARALLRNLPAGSHVPVELNREGKPVKLEIVLRDLI